MNRGYWLTPDGNIIDLGSRHHIDFIIDNPGDYGEMMENIKEAYDRYNERWRFEGKARDEIMQRVVNRGFIRIRETRNHWKIQLWDLDMAKYNNLSSWAKVIATQKRDLYGDVQIMDLSRHPLCWEYFTIIKLKEAGCESQLNPAIDNE